MVHLRPGLHLPRHRTAPAGRAGSSWIHLDDGDTPLVWLQLDREHTSFAGMEICAFELGAAPALDPHRPACG
ncbi:hypothetical protein ACWGIU_28570 [Streptomyces sp. NPDC054840]